MNSGMWPHLYGSPPGKIGGNYAAMFNISQWKKSERKEAKNTLQKSGMQTVRPVLLPLLNSHSMSLVIGSQQLTRSTM